MVLRGLSGLLVLTIALASGAGGPAQAASADGGGDALAGRLVALEQAKAEQLRRALVRAGATAAARRLAGQAAALAGAGSELTRWLRSPAGPGCTVGLLAFQQRGDRLWAIAGPPGRLVEVPLTASVAEVAEQARLMIAELDGGAVTGGGYQAPLVALRRALYDPAEPHLRGCTQLVVSPVGPVTGVPLHALVTRPDPRRALPRPHFLVEDVAVTYVPSLVLWTAPPAAALADEAVLAPAASEPELGGVALELRGRQRQNPAAVVHAGPDARRQVLRAALQQRQRVHVLAHGERATGRLPARLRMADGVVTPAELARVPGGAGLVVLSGCEMAPVPGAGRAAEPGFVPSLLAGGARRVLAAFLAVRDGEAAELMAAFDAALAAPVGPAEALARAQRQRIARLEAPHPRLWAGHTLYGGP
jgi:hypothetical protein